MLGVSRNGVPSRKGCVINAQTTNASNKSVRPPPAPAFPPYSPVPGSWLAAFITRCSKIRISSMLSHHSFCLVFWRIQATMGVDDVKREVLEWWQKKVAQTIQPEETHGEITHARGDT